MKDSIYHDGISSLLPDRSEELSDNFESSSLRESTTKDVVDAKTRARNAAIISKLKNKEREAIRKAKQKETEEAEAKRRDAEESLATLEAIDDSPEAQAFLSNGPGNDITPYTGTTRADVVRMMDSLGINLSLHLTKSDTYNLLSCLLTANETQLTALLQNGRTPLAIKTVVRRLLDDSTRGDIETIEKLWDRIFGKADKATLTLPQADTGQINGLPNGILPRTVVSREAYTIIRDTIIGN